MYAGAAVRMVMRLPTSVVLDRLLTATMLDQVTLAWVIARLRDRSFGILLFLLALLGFLPGASLIVSLLLLWPAVQMMMARSAPAFPRRIMQRRVSMARLAWLVRHLSPVLRWLETLVRPRWQTPFEATKRVVGAMVFLLSVTAASPIPFGQVVPFLAIMLIAFAYLEEDGMLLCVGLVAGLASLAVSAAAMWGTIAAVLLL